MDTTVPPGPLAAPTPDPYDAVVPTLLSDCVADLQGRLQSALGDAYHIERELGRGGMASVYLAEDRKHHRLVAIKVLKPELAAALGPERFLREIETAAQLNHPHILPLHDSGQAGRGPSYRTASPRRGTRPDT